ncbi:MAG: DNA polymerase III subunit delta [Eubacteriales bacterium]|nr:DNA polymerase III subunit delta [Eubacteriales bacterium]
MKRLNEDLNNDSFAPVYLLYGQEAYLLSQYKRRFRQAFLNRGSDMNVSVFNDTKIDLKEVRQTAMTVPFFADRRLVIVENSGWFQKKNEDSIDLVKELPATTTLVFIETQIDKRGRLYKTVAEKGYATELGEQPPQILLAWMKKLLKDAGKQADQTLLASLLERLGSSMLLIENELNKLISYVGEREQITAADITAISAVTVADHIFEMMKAIVLRDSEAVLTIVHDLFYLKQEPLQILGLLTHQLRILLKTRDLMTDGLGQREIMEQLKGQRWQVEQWMKQAGRFRLGELKRLLDLCADYDEAVKTGGVDAGIGMEALLIRLCRRG